MRSIALRETSCCASWPRSWSKISFAPTTHFPSSCTAIRLRRPQKWARTDVWPASHRSQNPLSRQNIIHAKYLFLRMQIFVVGGVKIVLFFLCGDYTNAGGGCRNLALVVVVVGWVLSTRCPTCLLAGYSGVSDRPRGEILYILHLLRTSSSLQPPAGPQSVNLRPLKPRGPRRPRDWTPGSRAWSSSPSRCTVAVTAASTGRT